jgi:hypothetical protein
MSKYDALKQHLSDLEGERWGASFREIEGILGFELPASAREYPAWWANQQNGQRVQCGSWMTAGWNTVDLNLPSEEVTFLRVEDRTTANAVGESTGEGAPTLTNEIRTAKARIASVAGVSPDKVKISIDF